MKRVTLLPVMVFLVCGGIVGLAAFGGEASQQADQARIHGKKGFGYDATLAVLPVKLVDDLSRKVGDALGLVLEQGGMPNVIPAAGKFEPPAGAVWEEMPALLAAYLKQNPPGSEYVMFAEFRGQPPAKGERGVVEAVRAIVMDRAGTAVWQTHQQAGEAVFDAVKPMDPMTCCVLVAECLRREGRLDTAAPAARETIRARQGRMAQLWAERAGLPPDEEFDAMAARAREFRRGGENASLIIYAAKFGAAGREGDAAAVVEVLQARRKASARAAAQILAIDVAPDSNAQKQLWELAKAFRKHMVEQPLDSGYGLCVCFVPVQDEKFEPRLVVCDHEGEWVMVEMTIKAMSAEQCADWVVRQTLR